MTRRRLQLAAMVVFVLGLTGASIALASGSNDGHGKHGKGNFRASLSGLQETPAIITTGRGRLALAMTRTQITFRLDYSDLSGPPLVAHIHVGQKGVAGNVSVFFCGGGGKPACPASASGSVSGTIVAADVLGPGLAGREPRRPRGARNRDQVGRRLREHAHDEVPRRRDPRTDRARARPRTRTPLDGPAQTARLDVGAGRSC